MIEEALRKGAGRRDVMRWLAAAGMGTAMAGGLLLRAGTAHAQTPKSGGQIRVAAQSASTADTLDPSRGLAVDGLYARLMFYNGLTRLDAKLVPQPELAESWTTTDAKVWSFKLRQGVTFHDGAKLTSADVVYTLNRVKDPKTGSTARALATQMTDIMADGPGAVRITLSAPMPTCR